MNRDGTEKKNLICVGSCPT